MTRAILFSGGVESVAALTLADKGDVLLVMQPSHATDRRFLAHKALPIAAHFGFQVQYLNAPGSVPCQQFWTLVALAMVWVAAHSETTEVWWGMNDKDVGDGQSEEFSRAMAAWSAAHPDVPLRGPLRHLTKSEQWALIPEAVRPLVHTCTQAVACGACHKCKERIDAGIPL